MTKSERKNLMLSYVSEIRADIEHERYDVADARVEQLATLTWEAFLDSRARII